MKYLIDKTKRRRQKMTQSEQLFTLIASSKRPIGRLELEKTYKELYGKRIGNVYEAIKRMERKQYLVPHMAKEEIFLAHTKVYYPNPASEIVYRICLLNKDAFPKGSMGDILLKAYAEGTRDLLWEQFGLPTPPLLRTLIEQEKQKSEKEESSDGNKPSEGVQDGQGEG